MNSTSLGREAEAAAAQYLQKQGFKIIERNWRRRTCEVDIIAQKDHIIYIVEVKYRTSDGQGTGLDYITPAKLKKINHSAQVWMAEAGWDGDMRLLGISVRADQLKPVIEQVVEL
jgi:putative endonuclease